MTQPPGDRLLRLQRLAVAAASWVLLVIAVAPVATASPAPRRCGPENSISKGQVFDVRATRTTCRTALQVAGGWFFTGQKHKIYDAAGRRWNCRVTEAATGTDPGYNPYTHVRCIRGDRRVRFKMRS